MENIRIQDDLYNSVNGEWLEKAVIPNDKPTVGGFSDLNTEVEKIMMDEFKVMAKTKNYPNSYLADACKVYKMVKNVKKRNKEGMLPLAKSLQKVDRLYNVAELNKNLAKAICDEMPLPFKFFVDKDMKDTSKYALYIQGPSVILPDVAYYKEGMEQQKEMILGIWKNMVSALLKMTYLNEEEQAKYIEDAIKFDAILATLVKSREEWSEYVKMYNPTKTSKVCSYLKPLKLKSAIKKVFGIVPEQLIVTEPRYFKGFSKVFNEENFEIYKHWAFINTILGATDVLSEDIRDIGSSYRRALSGIAANTTVEKHAYNVAQTFYSEPVGLYYGEKYFGEEAKKDIVSIVHEIIDTYKERVMKNDFLSQATKEKAIVKLSSMTVKMGYPDKINPMYDCLKVEGKNLFQVASSLLKAKRLYEFAKLKEVPGKDDWAMPGHMVNACYDPFNNDITFPAAILQPPFYSIKQTRSENLGGIGAVIGHEISHAFDNNGAMCDENGNINNWWTKEDLKKFEKRTKDMVKEFDGIELPWGKVNGKFIVSENIADNGGMAVTLEIMSKLENKSYEEYFKNWARVWCMKARTEYLQLLLQVDVHGPAILRANMQPRNFTEWYDTFGVKKTDKMYIAPKNRVIIW